ncbi:winged helix-turn-helix domain-containing protein [Enterovibrio norvegicus]|uniref:winged helix-turn-helix domain-containing protein n=1 Tax=Enterovibrio norvegicus TaxID=188144 RepID=UPI003D0F5435
MKDTHNQQILGNFLWETDSRQLKRIDVGNEDLPKEELVLTPKQFRLLKCLHDAHPNVLQREQIIDYVWESKPTSAESLPQLINRTRHALGDKDKSILVNAPGYGYYLVFTPSTPEDNVDNDADTEDTDVDVDVDIKTDAKEEEPLNAAPAPERSGKSKTLPAKLAWVALFAILSVFTLLHSWEVARGFYYQWSFNHVLHATPYPNMEIQDNGDVLITMDKHTCTYNKEKRLLQCT